MHILDQIIKTFDDRIRNKKLFSSVSTEDVAQSLTDLAKKSMVIPTLDPSNNIIKYPLGFQGKDALSNTYISILNNVNGDYLDTTKWKPMGTGVSLSGSRFFEKYDRYDLVYSSMSTLADGDYKPFTITPAMNGYYLEFRLNFAIPALNYTNIAWLFNFIGSFPDAFCIRIQPLALGGSKTNITDFYLTSGKAYDFVYNLELDHWAVDEIQSISVQDNAFLPQYGGADVVLTNTNYTYLFKIGDWTTGSYRNYILLPSYMWRGRSIKIMIDRDIPNLSTIGPYFYTTPYAIATGSNDYIATYSPSVSASKERLCWVKIPSDPTGLVTFDAGFGAKKVYASGVQAGPGDLISETVGESGIYELRYDDALDFENGGWNITKSIAQPDTIEGDSFWRFPYGVSGIKKGSYVVFESDGFGSIKISDMNIIV